MQSSSKTVLIVDDVSYVRKTLKQILTARGLKVVGEAENGEEAIRLYQETKPDLVTMDLAMPVLNGVDATREIIKLDPEARIIVLSAMMQENLVADAIMAGAKDYIIKPFQTDEVMKVMNQVSMVEASPRLSGGAA
ncbi:MAG: response regulator [Proteobacteria bacterium]|nr:response regulator [Pseudomonadota bacterium]